MNKGNNRSRQTEIIVIIPVYNCERYVKEATKSVLAQPYRNIFIVLVDDGSTDGSGRLCDELVMESDQVVALHQRNTGVSAARNAGIEYVFEHFKGSCQAQYIAFLDADDGWVSGFFSDGTDELLKKGYDLIGFQSGYCDAKLRLRGTPCEMPPGPHKGGQDNVWLHGKQSFGAMLYSKAFIQANGIFFFDELKYSEDKIFSMECMYLSKSIYLENRLLYLYRHTGSSAMHQRLYGIPYYESIINGYIKLDKLMREHSDGENLKPLMEARILASLYIMEMLAQHFQLLRSKKKIDKILAENTRYIDLLEASGEYSDLRPNPVYVQYRNHPYLYITYNNLIGGIKLCKRTIYKLWNSKRKSCF